MTTTPSDTPQDPGLRALQREIESAIHPEGMHLNDGRARFSIANVQRAVRLVAHLEAELQKVRGELVEARKENERLKIESKEGWDNFYKMRKQYGALKYGGRLQNQVVAMDGNRNLALEEAAAICDAQSSEPECPERAEYCADAIRALKDKTP